MVRFAVGFSRSDTFQFLNLKQKASEMRGPVSFLLSNSFHLFLYYVSSLSTYDSLCWRSHSSFCFFCLFFLCFVFLHLRLRLCFHLHHEFLFKSYRCYFNGRVVMSPWVSWEFKRPPFSISTGSSDVKEAFIIVICHNNVINVF